MPNKAILRTAGVVLAAANDVATHSPYRAAAHTLPAETQSPARIAAADVVVFVDRGTIELMVNGASALLGAGQFAQIAEGDVYAYCNAGTLAARVLVCPLRQEPPARTGVVVRIAAA